MHYYTHHFLCNFLLILLCWQNVAFASSTNLEWPIDCSVNEDCWIVNHVDTDTTTSQAKDFTCGNLTYDAHKGTDIAIKDIISMNNGVDVVAPMSGTVLRVRNNEVDHIASNIDIDAIKTSGKECGNGLILDHGDGWETKYCHMKQESILVKPGETVTTGQKLGEVGQSGLAEFPHLHIGVEHDKEVIDPFTGLSNQDGCNKMNDPLWDKELGLGYNPVSIYATGFSDQAPSFDTLVNDTSSLREFNLSSPIFTFWILMFGTKKGDQITIEISDPNKNTYAKNEITQDSNKIRQFYYVGKKNRKTPLLKGKYTGRAKLTRHLLNGKELTREITKTVIVK